MAYDRKELLERMLKFRNDQGRYPRHSDFKTGLFSPSKNVYYRHFESMEDAVNQTEAYERSELDLEDEADTSKVRSGMKNEGFQCLFCGSKVSNPEAFYSQLTNILINRFINLLNSENGESHYQGVLDCIYAVFGDDNPLIHM
jgi:hypothetical protein